MSTGTDLIAVETLKPAEVFVPGGVEKIICTVEAVVRATALDATTEEGRGAIKSLAYKIARSKTALDDMGKDFVAELKRATGVVDADRRTIRDRFDALRDEVRKPVDDWEAAESKRIDAHVAELATLKDLCQFDTPEPTVEAIDARIAEATRLQARDWQEFAERGGDLLTRVLPTLTALRKTVVQRAEERAELERLRKAEAERAEAARLQLEREGQEQLARALQEREEQIAREAREAEQRRQEQAVEAAERREREAVEAAQREVQESERRAREAEEDRRRLEEQTERGRKEAHEALLASMRSFVTVDPARSSVEIRQRQDQLHAIWTDRDWQEYADESAAAYADADKYLQKIFVQAEQREQRDRQDREESERRERQEREEAIAEEAREAERRRADAAAAAEAKAAAEREADLKHRAKINNETLADLMGAAGLNEMYAKAAILAIARGLIRNIKISY